MLYPLSYGRIQEETIETGRRGKLLLLLKIYITGLTGTRRGELRLAIGHRPE